MNDTDDKVIDALYEANRRLSAKLDDFAHAMFKAGRATGDLQLEIDKLRALLGECMDDAGDFMDDELVARVREALK